MTLQMHLPLKVLESNVYHGTQSEILGWQCMWRDFPPLVHLRLQTPHFTSISLHKHTMSSNVGLSTPRGSGTSGYVQRNLSYLKPRDRPAPYNPEDFQKYRQRDPDAEILEHERKRAIEVKVFELRDQLEDEG